MGAVRLPGFAPLMLAVVVGAIGVLIVAPLAVVFIVAFSKGVPAYVAALKDPDAQAAIGLTLLVASISVPLNAVFGLAAARSSPTTTSRSSSTPAASCWPPSLSPCRSWPAS